ncbi:hypothetical protein ILYODFUR_036366 [Ilyodon furcidens]|uniref:Uncharacterized protein n=1 Tax=Ilyodon furcidens TaxID=33524 RepID=A0ABV0UCL2_9TELE
MADGPDADVDNPPSIIFPPLITVSDLPSTAADECNQEAARRSEPDPPSSTESCWFISCSLSSSALLFFFCFYFVR